MVAFLKGGDTATKVAKPWWEITVEWIIET
jgi:hypothetical protein